MGHVSEIADAEPPRVPRGCPFQAWSVGEVLRLEVDVLGAGHPEADATPQTGPRHQRSRGVARASRS